MLCIGMDFILEAYAVRTKSINAFRHTIIDAL